MFVLYHLTKCQRAKNTKGFLCHKYTRVPMADSSCPSVLSSSQLEGPGSPDSARDTSHPLADIPRIVKSIPNYEAIHHILVYGSLKIERESYSIRNQSRFERQIEDLMQHNQGHGEQGLHAPNSSIHSIGKLTHHDVDLLGMIHELLISSEKARARTGGDLADDFAPLPDIKQACGIVSSIMHDIMDGICNLLGLETSEMGLSHAQLELPVLDKCSAEEILGWSRRCLEWMDQMYGELGRLDTLRGDGFRYMDQEQKADFSSKILACGVHMQTMIHGVLQDMQDTLSHETDVARIAKVVVSSVVDTIIQLQIDCTNRLAWFYIPFIRGCGIEYIQSVLQGRAPALPDVSANEEFDAQDHPLGAFMESPGGALAGQRDVEEVFRYSSDRLVCLLKGEGCNEMPVAALGQNRCSSLKVEEGKQLFRSFSSVLFVHGFLKAACSRDDIESVDPLCSRIAPLDVEGIKVVHRGAQNAAMAMVALKKGMKLIEDFSAGLRRDFQRASGDSDAQCAYYECTCKSAFLDYVMWQLNCWTFGRSAYLVQKCARKLKLAAGELRGQVLIDLMKRGEHANALERTRVSFGAHILRTWLLLAW